MTEPHDPFDALAASVDADDSRVDPAFAADLRARVERALDPLAQQYRLVTNLVPDRTSERSTSMSQPPRTQVITPYLCVHDAAAAIEWYREYFAATVSNVIPWDGRVGHAELDVAGAVFFLSDEAPSLGVVAPERDGSRTSVSVVVDVAAVEQFVERATSGGAVLQRPVEESHGARNAWIVDPFGHRWNLRTPVATAADTAARRAPSEPYYMTLSTADVERGAAFYAAVLGWEFAEPRNGGRHVTNTEMPIGLRPTENQFGTTDPGQVDMWFTVRDFDDALERVRVAGGRVVESNSWDSGREAICEDDQGVTFKLSEPAPGYDR